MKLHDSLPEFLSPFAFVRMSVVVTIFSNQVNKRTEGVIGGSHMNDENVRKVK